MNTKNKSRFKAGSIRRYTLLPLFCALFLYACDFPGAPPEEQLEEDQAYLTVNLSGARNARSILPDAGISLLVYKVTFTSPGRPVVERDVEGGSISITLDAEEWVIGARAYQFGDSTGTLVGTGTATVTLVPGQYQSVTVPMYVDPAYEAGLQDIYIHNEAELRRVAAGDFAIDDSMRFYLERDIVLTQPWTPIGDDTTPFEAVFFGEGHTITISSFSAAALGGMYLGLFGSTNGATIENFTIVYNNLTASSSYSGSQWLGGLAASATDTFISAVHVKGTIQYTAANALNIGGLVGGADGDSASSTDTQIYDSSFTGILKGMGAMGVSAGGILGTLNGTGQDAKIEESYAAGIINAAASSSDAYAGGIAGYGACTIENCYSTAGVTASAPSASSKAYAGGIIGRLPGAVTGFGKCYALGSVSADGITIYAGGIAGWSDSSIENCIALTEVDGGNSTTVGRVIGAEGAGFPYTPPFNYAASDKAITRDSSFAGFDGDTSYAISAFQGAGNQSKYATDLSWTFGSPGWKWITGYSYPVLGWQTEAPDVDLDNLGSGFTWP